MPGFSLPGILGTLCLAAGVIVTANTLVEALIMIIGIFIVLGIMIVFALSLFAKGVNYTDELTKAEKTRAEYRVNNQGLYHSLGVEYSKKGEFKNIYLSRIVEWKIDKFPRKAVSDKWTEYYGDLLNGNLKGREILLEELQEVKSELQELSYKVNLVRLYSILKNKSIFIWEKEFEKEKKENDEKLKMNLIIGGRVKVSTKNINGITIRQDIYNVIEKC